jgi:hypothetical protein
VTNNVQRIKDDMLPAIIKTFKNHEKSVFRQDNSCRGILLLFLAAVIFIAYIIPCLSYGSLFGTDEYTHLLHTSEIYSSSSLAEFYQTLSGKVSNPDAHNAPFNYPFGLWLFGGTISKIIDTDPHTASFLYSLIFVGILLVGFYHYAGIFFNTETQKLLALLLLVSMPNIAMSIPGFRPSVIVLPLLLLSLSGALKEQIDWKSAVLIISSVCMMVITHTGTFIFLLGFSIAFLLLYSLFWGQFSKPMFFLSASMVVIYVIAVPIFPHIHPQYMDKATLFLMPGNFFASNLNIQFARDISGILYTNIFVEYRFAYAIVWSALIYGLILALLFINARIAKSSVNIRNYHPIALLPTNLSKGLASIPIWLGPIHVLLSGIGFFHLDSKSKCLALTALLTTIFPEWLEISEGISGSTGATREIYYLIIIIPITAVLGFSYLITKLKTTRTGIRILPIVITVILASIIVVPAIGNSYYQPKISGDDYIINGMEWLSHVGSPHEKVVGYGYRMVSTFTDKETIYSLSGTDLKIFLNLLGNILDQGNEQAMQDLYRTFGIKYILNSDKIAANLGGYQDKMRIDANPSVDRIYSSRDFRIYSNNIPIQERLIANSFTGDVSIRQGSSTVEIESSSYKIILDDDSPAIGYIGTERRNYLEEGIVYDIIITTLGDEHTIHSLSDLHFSRDLQGNKLTYRGILQTTGGEPAGTITVAYLFYPDVIQREYIVSNDRSLNTTGIGLSASTQFFSPITGFVLFEDSKRVDRKVYPSEDGSKLDVKFNGVYLENIDSGIYMEYAPTTSYPHSLYYSGSTNYLNYSSVEIRQEGFLIPGASVKIVQYISIGDESVAKSRVNHQRGIDLYPYPDGIIPMTILETIPDSSKYNLNIIKEMDARKIPFLVTETISPPYYGLWDEGLRQPQMATYKGSTTDLVLLPVSDPPSNLLARMQDPGQFFPQWKAVIDSVAKNDDMAIFSFRTQDIENPAYSERFSEFFEYARQMGLTSTTPKNIADHYRKLQKVTYTTSMENDRATITVVNGNGEQVTGVTFKVAMPSLEEGDYQVSGGRIVRVKESDDKTIVYVATDLAPYESRTIQVDPGFERKHLHIVLPLYPIEGVVSIVVRGESEEPLKGAIVTIDGIPYETDAKGIVAVEMKRGRHQVSVEKGGYLKETFSIDVKGRIYLLHHLIYD